MIEGLKSEEKPLPRQRVFVNAGAGAGKTTNLVAHIVETFARFNHEKGRNPRIIGTTFTRKAANEIKDRVAIQYQRYQPENQHKLTDLERNSPYKGYIETHLDDLLRFAYSENLNITTIHGICVQVILRKAHLLGYSPNLKIVSEGHLSFYQKRLLFNLLSEEKFLSLYESFSFLEIQDLCNKLMQQKSILQRPAQLSDLNKVYEELISEMKVESKFILDFDLESLSGIGSAEDKAKAYVKYIQQALEDTIKAGDLGVFHRYLETRPATPTVRAGKNNDPSAIASYKEFQEHYKNLQKKYLDSDHYSKYFDKSCFGRVCQVNALLFDLYKKYEAGLREYKIENSFVLMNEVEELALEILTHHRSECQDFIDMWDFWYIDEYQDTSPIQSQIFEILLNDKSYYKVGDPQQSIYLFRGAESSLFIQEWEEAQAHPEIEDRMLDTNYRSHPNLMAGMNEFFKHLETQSLEFQESFKPMRSSKDIEKSDFSRFQMSYFSESEDEKQFVISEIKRLETEQGVTPDKICILARSRDMLEEYERELTVKQIPCLAQFSGGFLSRPEIQGALCFLKVMSNPHDDLELVRLLRTQDFKVEDSLLKTWCEAFAELKAWSLWEGVVQKQEHPSVQRLKDFYFYFKDKDYVEGFKKYLSELKVLRSGYDEMDQARRAANLMKIYSYICRRSESSSYTLESMIADLTSYGIEELQSEASFSQSQEGVRLFTIHGSKGLEFDYVFLVGGGKKSALTHVTDFEVIKDTGVFVVPVLDTQDAEKKATVIRYFSHKNRVHSEKKEIRRVIYVAATRAKEKLYVSGTVRKTVDASGEQKLSAHDQSLFNIIDIQNFVKSNWQHLSLSDQTKAVTPDLGLHGQWKHLKFSPQEQDLVVNKHIYQRYEVHKQTSREQALKAYSVSALVEAMAELDFKGFNFKEVRRLNISKVDFEKILSESGQKSSKVLTEQILKPYIGDVFHKAIELYSRKIQPSDLKEYLSTYFIENYEPIYNMILEIASLQDLYMDQVLESARPEWGFNSILENQILLSGKIDLWGLANNKELHIFDYKTGSLYHLRKAAFQLGLYKRVLSLIYPEHEIFTHVIYPAEGVVVSVEVGSIDISPLLQDAEGLTEQEQAFTLLS